MRKEKTRQNKGITLVALIITIVVLLILAVVSIGAIKDSNIIKHSQTASSEYTIAQEQEKLQLAVDEWEIAKNVPENAENLQKIIESSLEKDIESGEVTVDGNTEGPLTIIFKSGRQYSITKSGDIKEKNGDEPLSIIGTYGDLPENEKDKDFDYYKFNEDGTGETCMNAGFNRRTFEYSIESNGSVLITFDDDMSTQIFELKGTSVNKVIIMDPDKYGGRKAYTTNGFEGLPKLKNVSFKYYDEGEFQCNCSFDEDGVGQFWLGEQVGDELITDYFVFDEYVYTRDDDDENRFYSLYKIEDDKLIDLGN